MGQERLALACTFDHQRYQARSRDKMSARYTQTKSEAQKHTEILKAMLKQPENKVSWRTLVVALAAIPKLTSSSPSLSSIRRSCVQIARGMVSCALSQRSGRPGLS